MESSSGRKRYNMGNDTNVLLDTGHTFSNLHEAIVDQVWQELNATFESESGYPIVDCAKRDMDGGMIFTFRNKTITVPFQDVILTAEGLCAVGLLKTASTEQQVLGITFLRAAYGQSSHAADLVCGSTNSCSAVFDWDNEEIHLAQAANCGSDIVPITTGLGAVPSITGCVAATYPTLPASDASSRARGVYSGFILAFPLSLLFL